MRKIFFKPSIPFVSLIIVSCMMVSSLQAQMGLSIGPKFGYSFTSLHGTDAGNFKSKSSWVGGLFLNFQLAPSLAIQPELLLTEKGAIQTRNNVRNDIKINYFEVPVLLKLRMPVDNMLLPHILIGPNFAFKTNSSFHSTDTSTGENVSINAGDIRKSDVGGIIGAGIDFQASWLFLTVDGRYGLGFSDIGKSGDNYNLSIKNKGWTFAAGIGLRLGH